MDSAFFVLLAYVFMLQRDVFVGYTPIHCVEYKRVRVRERDRKRELGGVSWI